MYFNTDTKNNEICTKKTMGFLKSIDKCTNASFIPDSPELSLVISTLDRKCQITWAFFFIRNYEINKYWLHKWETLYKIPFTVCMLITGNIWYMFYNPDPEIKPKMTTDTGNLSCKRYKPWTPIKTNSLFIPTGTF